MQKVYVIGPDAGPFKVGISSDVNRRLSQLQTGNHSRLSVHFVLDSEDALILEGQFHSAFAEARLNGEWFNAPLETIVDALKLGFSTSVELDEHGGAISISSASFIKWLSNMKSAGLADTDLECARLLGISANSVVTMKKQGADLRTALACRALLHRMEPYS